MSNFDLTFCKVYIYAKGCPGINLGAWHESCAHPTLQGESFIHGGKSYHASDVILIEEFPSVAV